MWPMVSGRSWAKAVRSYTKDDRDVLVGDVNALHQRPDDITAHLPIGVGEPGADVGRELLHPPHHQREVVERAGVVGLSRQRFCEVCYPLPEATDARLKFLLGDKALGITVDEASEPLTDFADVHGVRKGLSGRRLLLQLLQAPLVLLFDAPGFLLWVASIRPHCTLASAIA